MKAYQVFPHDLKKLSKIWLDKFRVFNILIVRVLYWKEFSVYSSHDLYGIFILNDASVFFYIFFIL